MKKYIAMVIGILIVVVGTTAYLNMKRSKPLLALEANAQFQVLESEEVVKVFTMEDIEKLPAVDFQANLKKNGQDPITYTYTGVPLRVVLEEAGIDLSGKSQGVVTAVDGYAVPYDMAKIMEEDNIYLAYRQEGEPLGNKDNKGSGPFMVIVSKDAFSQNWSKFATQVHVE